MDRFIRNKMFDSEMILLKVVMNIWEVPIVNFI